jgi:hypothetical protein
MTDRRSGLRFRQTAMGITPVLAGALLMAGMAVTSWEEGGQFELTDYYTALAAHPVRAQVSTVLIGLGFLMLVPSFTVMAQLTRHRGTKLGNAGWVFGTLGFGIMAGLAMVVDVYDTLLATELGIEQAVALGQAAEDLVAPVLLGMASALGSTLGLLFIAAALWRSRELPVWGPPLLLAGALAFFLAPSALIPMLIASTLLTGGLLAVTLRVVTAEDWELGGPTVPALVTTGRRADPSTAAGPAGAAGHARRG